MSHCFASSGQYVSNHSHAAPNMLPLPASPAAWSGSYIDYGNTATPSYDAILEANGSFPFQTQDLPTLIQHPIPRYPSEPIHSQPPSDGYYLQNRNLSPPSYGQGLTQDNENSYVPATQSDMYHLSDHCHFNYQETFDIPQSRPRMDNFDTSPPWPVQAASSYTEFASHMASMRKQEPQNVPSDSLPSRSMPVRSLTHHVLESSGVTVDKPPNLACFFCRGRKIACGRVLGAPESPCNQCSKRGQKCVYPAGSRRGQHKRGTMKKQVPMATYNRLNPTR